MGWFRRPPAPPAVPDRPDGFGYKMAWFAVRGLAPAGVAATLGLGRVRPCNWAAGVAAVYARDWPPRNVFVTPPVQGWVFAVGWPLVFARQRDWLDVPRVVAPLRELSRTGVACFFSSHRVSESHVWAKAEAGGMVRAYGYESSHDGLRWEVGRPTPEELAAGAVFPPTPADGEREADEDAVWSPGEEHVVAVAAGWSLDPTTLGDRPGEPGVGLLGRPSGRG